MTANDPKKSTPEVVHHHPPEGTVAWFFYEFWPIIFFAGFFVLMVSLPLVAAGTLSPYAILIILAFLGSLAVTFLAARFIGLYMFLLAVGVFILQPQAFQKAFWIGACFFLFLILGMIKLPQKKEETH